MLLTFVVLQFIEYLAAPNSTIGHQNRIVILAIISTNSLYHQRHITEVNIQLRLIIMLKINRICSMNNVTKIHPLKSLHVTPEVCVSNGFGFPSLP